MLSLVAGALRQAAPGGLSWRGLWPDKTTSALEAYNMFAREGDPAFMDLSEAVKTHQHQSATFVDARSREEFAKGRIPGARSLPFYDLDSAAPAALENLTTEDLLVVYCEGINCELSFFLGRELAALGFTNVRIFYGGFPEWIKAGMPVEKI